MKSIINRRRACANSSGIVFVEYVYNRDNSYIDTGVSIESQSNINYEIRFALPTNPSTNVKYAIFGAESSDSVGGLHIYCYKNKAIQAKNQYGSMESGFALQQKVDSINSVKCDGKVLTVNGSVIDDVSKVTSFSTRSLYLFNINTVNHTEDYSVAPMKFFKAYLSIGQKSQTTLFDLTPCRIGNAGYIYDSISDRLLGDGRFVPGPDAEPKI